MKVQQPEQAKELSMKKRRRRTPEQIVKTHCDADAMLSEGKSLDEVLQSLVVSEATLGRWRSGYNGMKSEESKRLKSLEEENIRLKRTIGDQAMDVQMLRDIAKGN